MANVGGKAVGRVRVRAVPDSSQFRRDLKVMLTRAERTMSMTLKVDADLDAVENQLRRFKRDWDGKKVNLGANIRSAAAAAQLRFLSRERFVTLSVRVSKASLVKVGTALAALSGGRIVGDLVKNVTESLGSLDRALPKIALVANAVGSLASLSLTAVGGLFTLGTGLLQVFGVAAALPGILAGLAVGATVLVLALSDTKNQLADLAPDFQNLRAIVVDNFWAVAAQPIRDFVSSVLPSLQSGLQGTATSVGNWASSLLGSFQSALGGGVLDKLFANLNSSIDIAATGTGGFAQALVTLAGVGSDNLPRLAQWVADLSNRFNDFITRVEADGSLQKFIDNGVLAAQQLWDSLSAIVSIFSGVTDAATAAGGGGLASFATTMAAIAAAVNSPAFQSVLTQFFSGAAEGASGLASALEPIGNMLLILAPTISNILASSGQVVGDLLGQIADAASSPVFQKGLIDFFDGLQAGLLAVGPALPALASAFGTFLGFAGQLAGTLGGVLATAITTLAPVFVTLLKALEPILPILGQSLVDAITKLAPSFMELATTLTSGPLLPALLDLVVALLPGIVSALIALADVVQVLMTPTGLPSLGSVFGPIIAAFGDWMTAMLEGRAGLEQFGAVFTAIGITIGNAFAGVGDMVKQSLNNLLSVLEGGINGAITMVNSFVGPLQGLLDGLKVTTGGAINITLSKLPKVSLPRLKVGADILPTPGGTAFIGGEGGKRETVTDWGRTNRLISLANSLASRALTGGSGLDGATITIPVTAAPGDDPRITGAVVGRAITDLMAGR